MKFTATVKVLHEVKSGISDSTGDAYKYQGIILEFEDGEKKGRVIASMGTRQVESALQQQIGVGSRVIVDLSFSTHVNYNKFVDNRIYVNNIQAIGSLPMPQVPSLTYNNETR